MTRLAAAGVALALALCGGAAAKRPLLLAMVWKGSVVSLTRVDPTSLRPVGGRSLAIGRGAYVVARSPRGVTLAFNTPRGARLSLVEARSLRLRGEVFLGDGAIGAAAWPTARRIVALVGSEGYSRVVTIDPATRQRLTTRLLPVRGYPLASAATAARVVFLLGEPSSIAPVRLGVAGVDGDIRLVVLTQISGGSEPPEDYSTGVLQITQPALAVSSDGRRAAVVDGRGLVAEVDLDTLAVSYHPRPVRVPARAAKAVAGSLRTALWLRSGALAVTGMDYSATVTNGSHRMTGTPAGLMLVDTNDWSSRVVDDGASSIGRAGVMLLAYGGKYESSSEPSASIPTGIGLRGYSLDGTLRFQLFGAEQIGDAQTAGGLVYVAACDDRCFRIVDPASGGLVGEAQTAQTTQLVGL